MNDQSSISHAPRDVRHDPLTAGHFGNVTPMLGTARHTGFIERKKFVAKGHDAQLMDAQHNNLMTTITTMGGDSYTGVILKRDKFTITLRLRTSHQAGGLTGEDEIFYKHAIESVRITRPTTI